MGPVSFERLQLGDDEDHARKLAGLIRTNGVRVESFDANPDSSTADNRDEPRVDSSHDHRGDISHDHRGDRSDDHRGDHRGGGYYAVVRSSDLAVARALLASDPPDPYEIEPLRSAPTGSVVVPGSKSHTNRALICAALASGVSVLDGILLADDTEALLAAIATLGAEVEVDRDAARVTITGTGGQLRAGPLTLDADKSGTTSRFLVPMATVGKGDYTIDGDPQLRARPFDELVDALVTLGADIDGRSLPLRVHAGTDVGGAVEVDGSTSSQFLSGLLLSAPQFARPTVLTRTGAEVSSAYLDLTVATMAAFGAPVRVDGRRFEIDNGGYQAASVQIEPDASAASYFFAAAAMTGGRVTVKGLNANTVQGDVGFVDVLAQMGAAVTFSDDSITVEGRPLRGVEVDMSAISDTVQTLAMVATVADGPTTMTNIGFIRAKETDRIAAPATELERLGIEVDAEPDSLTVHPGTAHGGIVQTYDDHRMAMSFALLGLLQPGIRIANPGCVAKTFPRYFEVLNQFCA